MMMMTTLGLTFCPWFRLSGGPPYLEYGMIVEILHAQKSKTQQNFARMRQSQVWFVNYFKKYQNIFKTAKIKKWSIDKKPIKVTLWEIKQFCKKHREKSKSIPTSTKKKIFKRYQKVLNYQNKILVKNIRTFLKFFFFQTQVWPQIKHL